MRWRGQAHTPAVRYGRDDRALLHIVHVNDTEANGYEHWPRLAAAIRMLQAARRCDVLLHAGDVSLASPPSDAKVQLMNRLGFDAVVPGNHDLDSGLAALRAPLAALHADALCANVSGPAANCFRPYRLMQRRRWRIAVCGVTLGDMALLQPEHHLSGMMFAPPEPVLRTLVPRLRQEADLVVVLSHCGYEPDLALARIPGVDLIVGGHSHDLLPTPSRVGGAWVVQAGAEGTHVGRLTVQRVGAGMEVFGGVLSTAQLAPDPEALSLAPPPSLDEEAVVGSTAVDLRSAEWARETPLGNLSADLLRTAAGADVALLRCSSVLNTLPAGPIRRRDLARMNATGADRVARLEATGRELRAILECGAQEAYFLLTTSGARVVYAASRPVGERVDTVEIGGAPLEPERRYTVACLEILARGASAFTPFRGKPYALLSQTLNDLLAQYICTRPSIAPTLDGRLIIRGRLPSRSPHRHR